MKCRGQLDHGIFQSVADTPDGGLCDLNLFVGNDFDIASSEQIQMEPDRGFPILVGLIVYKVAVVGLIQLIDLHTHAVLADNIFQIDGHILTNVGIMLTVVRQQDAAGLSVGGGTDVDIAILVLGLDMCAESSQIPEHFEGVVGF